MESIVVTFVEGSAEAELEVFILDDKILEGPHAIIAEIQTTNPLVNINTSASIFTVNIRDDEGN